MVEAREDPFDARSGRASSLHEQMRRWIESVFSERARRSDAKTRTRTRGKGEEPESEVLETEDAYILGLHVPGHLREDLTVEIENAVITVRGRNVDSGGDAFTSRFSIDGEVAEEELTAAYRDGMLAIRIPKYAISKPGRQIEITFRDG